VNCVAEPFRGRGRQRARQSPGVRGGFEGELRGRQLVRTGGDASEVLELTGARASRSISLESSDRAARKVLTRRPCVLDQRSDLNAARTSVEKSSGSSQAAKWPPLSTLLK
jgi:hypothetical protein